MPHNEGLANVEQRLEQARVQAVRFKRRAFRQNRYRVMAVQAFLVAGHHPEVADPMIGLQLLGEQTRRIFNKNFNFS